MILLLRDFERCGGEPHYYYYLRCERKERAPGDQHRTAPMPTKPPPGPWNSVGGRVGIIYQRYPQLSCRGCAYIRVVFPSSSSLNGHPGRPGKRAAGGGGRPGARGPGRGPTVVWAQPGCWGFLSPKLQSEEFVGLESVTLLRPS